MELTVSDRILLLNMLPHEGNLTDIRASHAISKELEFSEAERATLDFKTEGGTIRWDATKDMPVPVSLLSSQVAFINGLIDKASDEGKLTVAHVPLLEKLCPEAKLRAV